MAIVGLLVAVPVTLLTAGGEDAALEPATVPTASAPPPLGEGARDRGLRVRYRVPKGWRESRRASAIRLRSRDRTAEIVIAAPAPAARAGRLLEDTLAAIRRSYDAVQVNPGSGREIGGLRARGAVISARSEATPLRILVAVAKGRKRAYLVEVFTAEDAPGERLREAQVALNSLRLGG